MRPVVPFQLPVRLGDIVSIARRGDLAIEGSCETKLGLRAGNSRPPEGRVTRFRQGGSGTSCEFRLNGDASTIMQGAVPLKAGFNISFPSADGWVLAYSNRVSHHLDNQDRFREPIIAAYQRGVWDKSWALVVAVGRVDKITLITARTAGTKIELEATAEFDQAPAMEVGLTAGLRIAATSHQFDQLISTEPLTAYCSLKGVREHWWQLYNPVKFGILEEHKKPGDDQQDFFADWDLIGAQA